ncbi:MAG: hypothetical protein QOG54_673 [Actinomycetota bacterium]|nr:hypothetical protein [Actinomycetota bacterium]
MIDFRYHLISLIAVFLALGLGILMGSVVLDEQLVNRLNDRVNGLSTSLDERRAEVEDLRTTMDTFQDYAQATQAQLISGELAGDQIVAITFEGTDGSVVDAISDSIDTAGGTVVSRLTLTDRFALRDQAERDQLALILRSTSGTAAELRDEAGTDLGLRAAAAASQRDLPRGSFSPDERLEGLIDELQEAGFLGLSRTTPNQTVPPGASFVIVGGGADPLPWKATSLAVALGNSIADLGVTVTAAEPSNSVWQFVDAFRSDGKASAQVSTVDHADTVPGRVALVLALKAALNGQTGHYGADSGASSVLPEPSPSG